MSNCGGCGNKTCSCLVVGDSETIRVIGLGATYKPYQFRPVAPDYRPVGYVRRTSSQLINPANTNIPITFQSSMLGGSSIDMWKLAAPTRLTIPITGLYLVGGYLGVYNPGGGTVLMLSVCKNGNHTTPLVKRSVSNQVGGFGLELSTMTLVRLVATDYIELVARSTVSVGTDEILGTTGTGATFDANPAFWANYMGAY